MARRRRKKHPVLKFFGLLFVLCAVLYDTGKFVEAEIIKCPGKNGDIAFDSTVYGYHECKLFLLDENFTPVCSEVVCD